MKKYIKHIIQSLLSIFSLRIVKMSHRIDKMPIIDTVDHVREAMLKVISDEINDRNLVGSVAELGVYRGSFARMINKVFPDRKLYLFDTFEGFDEEDVKYDNSHGYLDDKGHDWTDTSINYVLNRMLYPKMCHVIKGYFPKSLSSIIPPRKW